MLTTLVFKSPAILLHDAALQFLSGFGRNGRERRRQGSSPSSSALNQESPFWACCCTSTAAPGPSRKPLVLVSYFLLQNVTQTEVPSFWVLVVHHFMSCSSKGAWLPAAVNWGLHTILVLRSSLCLNTTVVLVLLSIPKASQFSF